MQQMESLVRGYWNVLQAERSGDSKSLGLYIISLGNIDAADLPSLPDSMYRKAGEYFYCEVKPIYSAFCTLVIDYELECDFISSG